MVDFLYNFGKTEFFKGNIDLLTDTIKAALLVVAHVPDQDNDDYYSDVSGDEVAGGGYVAGGSTLAGKTVTQDDANNRAVFDANDITTWNADTFTGVQYLVIYKDTGVAGTSQLICLFDFLASKNAPLVIQWNADGIFAWGDC